MSARIAILLAALALPLPAQAELTATQSRYLCERGVELPVSTVADGETSVVVLTIEGRQITLWQEEAASGARYGWPSDGSSYVWWSKGDTATLLWKDGAAGTETVLLSDCKAQS